MRLVSLFGVILARLFLVMLALVGVIIAAEIFVFGLAAAALRCGTEPSCADPHPIPLVVLELVLGAGACGALGWLAYRTVRYAVLTFAPRNLAKPIAAATTLSLLWLFALFATIDSS